MKKIIISLALASIILVSCQEKTKEKLEDAKEAIGTEVEQKMDTFGKKIDTLGHKIEIAADSLKSKTKKATEKIEEGAKKVKESVKK